jgi:hypothetical protein
MPKKILFLENSWSKINPKKAWKSINNLLGRQNKPTVVNELNVCEQNLTSPEDIAGGFNEYLSNIGPDLASKIDYSNSSLRGRPSVLWGA